MTSIRALVAALSATEPARPRLTWYGPGSERVELSGRVLVNGVVKATNLLVAEADAGPGSTVLLDLPVHWRALQWALAAWTCGAQVRTPAAGATPPPGLDDAPAPAREAPADVVVTDRPAAGTAELVVAVPLPALALRHAGPLPAGALDGVADLMTYPDALGWVPPTDPGGPGLGGPPGAEPPVRHGDLLTWARRHAGADTWPGSPRVLVHGHDLTGTLAAALAAWAAGGSVVLVAAQAADLDALAAQERVSLRA